MKTRRFNKLEMNSIPLSEKTHIKKDSVPHVYARMSRRIRRRTRTTHYY